MTSSYPHDQPDIAIICALPLEYDAIELLLDHRDGPGRYRQAPGDSNVYTSGTMGGFSVVLVRTEMGTTRAATTGARLCSSFPGLSLVLITGICGGVPSQAKREDLLLGDVVVSKSIAQHGFGKQYPDVFEAKDTYNYTPGNLQKHVRNAINTFETTAATMELEKLAAIYLEKIQASGTGGPRRECYQYPGANQDQLFRPTYRHKHHVSGQCNLCARCSTTSDPVCDESRTSFCHQLKCSDEYVEQRERLEKNKQLESQGLAKQAQKPKVFFGCVASGSVVLKCGEKRDKLAVKLSERSGEPVLGFEMEGAGVWDELPCLVVKGVCDYADSHKNKRWQDFAAATAAAMTRAIIEQWPKTGLQRLSAVARTDVLQSPAFPAVYYIPYPRNDEVIQRPDLVAQLRNLLSAVETSQNAALCGLGGSGKTQLALQYAYSRLEGSACSVFWVHAENEATFTHDYKQIAIALDLDIRGCSDEDMLSKVRQAIQKQPRWLLVVDNADNLELFGVNRPVEQTISAQSTMAIRGKTQTSLGTLRTSGVSGTNKALTRPTKASSSRSKSIGGVTIAEQTPSKAKVSRNLRPYIPIGAGGTVLWTTRDEGIRHTLVSGRRIVNVARMEPQEARQLLSNTGCEGVGDVDKSEDVDQLLEELQWLPLAISQAGAYMRGALMGVDEYLRKIREGQERWKTLKTTYHDPHRRPGVTNSVLETWHISIEYLRQHGDAEHQLAYKILHILAYFDNQNIQWELIQAAAAYSKDKSQKYVAPDEVTLGRAIKRLKDFSFLSDRRTEAGGEKSFEMHKLVQEGVRYRLQRMAAEAVSAEATTQQASNRVRKTVTDTRLAKRTPTATPSGRRQAPASPAGSRSSRPAVAPVAENQGERHFACAALQIIITLLPWSEVETWKQCEKYLAHAMHVADHADVGGEPLELADLLWRISNYLFDRQRWREKEGINLRLGALLRKERGDTHPDTLDSMNDLAITYDRLGRLAEAEEIVREVLRHQKELFGETHPSTLATTYNLASLRRSQGHYSEAEELLSIVISAQKEALGDAHPDTIRSRAELAATYHAQGHYDKAEQIEMQVLEQQQQLLGDTHPDTIYSRAQLAAIYYAQGYYDKAEQIEMQALEQRQQLLGDTHPDTIYSHAQLAAIYYAQGYYDIAEQIEMQVLEQQQKLLGDTHPDTIDSRADLASTYYQQGHYDRAEQIQMQVLEQRQQLLGDTHPDTIDSRADLASTYYSQGHYDRAEQIEVQVLEQRQQLLGDTHPYTLWAKYSLACTLHKLGYTADSTKLMEVCFVQCKEALGPDHPRTKDAEDALNEWVRLES